MGNAALMGELGVAWHSCEGDDGTVIHVAIDGRYAGHILISDEARGDAAQAISQLKAEGVARVVMLTGDRNDVAGLYRAVVHCPGGRALQPRRPEQEPRPGDRLHAAKTRTTRGIAQGRRRLYRPAAIGAPAFS